MTKIRFTGFLFLLLALSAPSLSAQTGLFVHDRLTQQRSLYPQERLYVHTDAEDYLQGDRIWLKAYLMDEVYHTPEDSTLYVYAELFDRSGDLVRRIKLLRRQGAFSGYLDIPEDMPSGDAYLRAYSRYMAAAPETAFTKRISVGRTPTLGTVAGGPRPRERLPATRMEICPSSAVPTGSACPIRPGNSSICWYCAEVSSTTWEL